MATKPSGTPSMGEATKKSTSKASAKRQQAVATERSRKLFPWLCGIVVALLPLIFSIVNAFVIYGDNIDVNQPYLEFAKGFLFDGDLLWVAVALLTTSLLSAGLVVYLASGGM